MTPRRLTHYMCFWTILWWPIIVLLPCAALTLGVFLLDHQTKLGLNIAWIVGGVLGVPFFCIAGYWYAYNSVASHPTEDEKGLPSWYCLLGFIGLLWWFSAAIGMGWLIHNYLYTPNIRKWKQRRQELEPPPTPHMPSLTQLIQQVQAQQLLAQQQAATQQQQVAGQQAAAQMQNQGAAGSSGPPKVVLKKIEVVPKQSSQPQPHLVLGDSPREWDE